MHLEGPKRRWGHDDQEKDSLVEQSLREVDKSVDTNTDTSLFASLVCR